MEKIKYNWFSVSIFLRRGRPKKREKNTSANYQFSPFCLLCSFLTLSAPCERRRKRRKITEIAIIMELKFPKNWNNSFLPEMWREWKSAKFLFFLQTEDLIKKKIFFLWRNKISGNLTPKFEVIIASHYRHIHPS